MKSAMDRLRTTKAVLDSIDENRKSIEERNTNLRLMDVIMLIDNPYIKARVILDHHRRRPESKLNAHSVFSKREAQNTIRALAKSSYNNERARWRIPVINRKMQNIENGGGTI